MIAGGIMVAGSPHNDSRTYYDSREARIMVVLIYRVAKDGINENPADPSQGQPEKP